MRRELFGPDDGPDLVVILGWGNEFEFETVQWLLDQLTDAGYRVHGFQIPTVVTDFETEWLDPVADYVTDFAEYRLLTHSTGGLIGEFLDDPAPVRTVHLSPWWGFHDDLDNPIVNLAMKLPLAKPILPAGIDKASLGTHTTDHQVEATPSRAAPTFLREARWGQDRLPPFDDDTVVFYTPQDPVVGADAIEARTPERNRISYDGGHELFGSASREDHIDTVLAALDSGVAALD